LIAEYPDQIGVFRIQTNGSLKLLSTAAIDEQGEGLFSLSIFPNTIISRKNKIKSEYDLARRACQPSRASAHAGVAKSHHLD
jgi:hypothetical protein